jgi:hypothetical protein
MAAEITQIDTQDFTSQTYEGSDTSLLSQFEIDTSLTSNSYIEYFVYDNNKNLLSTDYSFSEYTVLNDGQSAGTNNSLSQIEIDPEKSLINSGYDQGEYITYFNILNKQIGSELQQLYITEISSDRTEIRLDSTSLTESDIVEQTNIFIQERENSAYFLDFYLNFGDNNLFISNNISLDNQDPTNPTVLIKLYEPLSDEFDINSTLWVVTILEEPIAYKVTFEDIPIIFTDTTGISGPNFNLDLKDQVNNSSLELSYADLVLTSLTSSANQLNSLLEEKEIDINVDYTDFSNFTHFSSVQSRIENFYYKVGLIENYSSSIATLNNTINNNPSASIAIYESKINNIITNFDGYDYYLYYSSESLAYPKTNSSPPYNLYSTTSPTVLTWLGSANETSIYYGGILLSASIYDNLNQNNLYFTIPEYLREDPANDPYQLFIEMVGQHYDNIWIYYKDVTQKYNADNRLENGISKDIVADAIRDFGIKLYQNNFSNEDLYTAFLGLTPEGGLFPFPNITGSLPTPSGYEYVNTKISASNDYLPLDDVNKSLYKRIYHNLPYLLQTKGTLPGLRALITSYGIPDTILRIKEYGGKDKVNTNDWDYWQNEFNYAYKQNGNNFISSSFVLNSSWGATSNNPETVMFRFKTNGLPTSSIPYSQSLFLTKITGAPTSTITLRYTGSAYSTVFPPSSSYSGSIVDPYYQYAYLDFHPDATATPNLSASIYLPFFDGDWWSVIAKKTGTGASTNFELYSGNKMYDGGENGTSISFFATSSVIADDSNYNLAIQANFGSGSITVNSKIYNSFSGSFQEIRYYSEPISESVFKDFVMNPSSIEGNSLNSGADQLAFRLPLGGELYTGSNSIHPKVTGSWITTSSFASNSTASFNSTPTFVKNTEYFYYDQPIAGIKNAIADKIRIENNVIPGGDVLSPFMSLSQQANISQSYTANTNLLEVAFSPQDEINDDINSSLGYFNIGEYIGDPRLRSSSAEFYPSLDALRDSYFQKYTKNYNLVDFFRLIKFFDNSLFKMIKDFVPARTSLASGIVIKQHILERNKVPQPQVDTNSTIAYYPSGSTNNQPLTFQDISVSGTIAPQWNDYNEGTVENFNGGTAGTFEIFNGVNSSPYGPNGTGPENIFNLTQSWYETVPTISGSVSILHDAQDEFYDGEFEGSTLIITTQSLNPPLPNSIISFDYTPVRYSPQNYGLNVSSSFAESQFLNVLTVPDQGEILLLSPYSRQFIIGQPTKGTNSSIYVKIHKKDNNGFDNDVALGQATRLRIKYDILPNYLTIGNILTKTEYSTYWLYKVQSLGSNTADNYIKDYKFSGSIAEDFNILGNNVTVLALTESIDNANIFNPSTSTFTYSNTPNVAIHFTASILGRSSSSISPTFPQLSFSNDPLAFYNSNIPFPVSSSSPATVTISGTFFPLNGSSFTARISNISPFSLSNIYDVQFQLTQSIAPSSQEYDPVIIEPYIAEPNFYNSDNNALLNSVNEQRESTFALDVDYSDGTTPINFALLITGSATPATVPDSNYTSKKSILLKYDGSKSTSQLLNKWTQGDTEGYGKLPSIESLRTAVIYADWIGGWPPEIEGVSAANILYLIKEDGSLIKPWQTQNALFDLRYNFTDGERVTISSLSTNNSTFTNSSTTYKILKSGYQVQNILYNQIGQSPSQSFSSSIFFGSTNNTVYDPQITNIGDYNVKYNSIGSNSGSFSKPFSPSDSNSINNYKVIYFSNPNVTGIDAKLFTNPSPSSKFYQVTQSIKDDKQDLTFNFNVDFKVNFDIGVFNQFSTFKVAAAIYNQSGSNVELPTTETLIYQYSVGGNSFKQFNINSFSPTSNFNFSYTLPYTSLGANNSYYVLRLKVYDVSANDYNYGLYNKIYLSSPNFSIQQALPPGNYNTGISTANMWNSASGTAIQGVTLTNILNGGFTASISNNLLFTTQSFLVNMFDSNNLIQKSITGSGFNQIELPFSLKPNDEFKFEGKENQTYTVIQARVISASGASSPPTGPVSQVQY